MKPKSWNAKHLTKWMRKGECPGCGVDCGSDHQKGCKTRKAMLEVMLGTNLDWKTTPYARRLVELAKEIHEMQVTKTKMLAQQGGKIKIDWDTIQLNSKINYLIGYILGLEE